MAKEKDNSFWSKPAVRWAATLLLGVVFVVALVVFLAAGLISRTLMDPEIYNSALEESDFYNRIYTDLLADPAMVRVTAEIMGDLNLDPSLSSNVLSLATSTLYLVVPPEAIQSTVEGAINSFTAYLTGETGGLVPIVRLDSLDADDVADRMVDGMMAMIGTLFAEAITDQQAAIAGYDEEQLAAYIAEISGGRLVPVPENLAAASVADLSPEDRATLVKTLLGPEEENASATTRLQIEAALQADDLAGAVAMASSVRARARAEAAADDFVATVQDSEQMSTLRATAEVLGQTQSAVKARLEKIQSLIITLDKVIMPLEFVIMVLALAGIVWIQADNLVAMLRATGLVLVIGSGLVALGWRLIGSAVGDFLDERFLASSELPVSLENMIGDVVEMVVGNAWSDV